MKIFWAFLGLMVLAACIYFWLGSESYKNFSGTANSTYADFLKKLSVLKSIKDKSVSIWDDVSGFIDSTEKKITGVKNFLDTAPTAVSSTISGLYDEIKSQLPPAALKLLSGETKNSLQNFISPGGQFSVSTSSATLSGNICVEFRNGTGVNYSIQNPFSPAKDYAYRIDWGDGATSDGNVKSSDTPLLVSHNYGHPGDYQNLFSITSGSSTLSTQVRVCIR